MSRLIETIKLLNGKFSNLSYHQERMNRSMKELFPSAQMVELENFLMTRSLPQEGLHKCRVIYNDKICKVEFESYQRRVVKSLKLVRSDDIEYQYKWEDRSLLLDLLAQKEGADDIIIIKKDYVTDSSYANLAFEKNGSWYTPKHCLLKGTMRQYLLDNHLIREKAIAVNDIRNFSCVKLVNSMLGFEFESLPIKQII